MLRANSIKMNGSVRKSNTMEANRDLKKIGHICRNKVIKNCLVQWKRFVSRAKPIFLESFFFQIVSFPEHACSQHNIFHLLKCGVYSVIGLDVFFQCRFFVQMAEIRLVLLTKPTWNHSEIEMLSKLDDSDENGVRHLNMSQ